jgi:hypothetical protein
MLHRDGAPGAHVTTEARLSLHLRSFLKVPIVLIMQSSHRHLSLDTSTCRVDGSMCLKQWLFDRHGNRELFETAGGRTRGKTALLIRKLRLHHGEIGQPKAAEPAPHALACISQAS